MYGSWSSGLDSNQIIFHISEHNIVDVQENGSYNIKDTPLIIGKQRRVLFYLQNIFYTYQILEKINHMTFNYLTNTEFELEQNLIIFSGNTTTTFDTTNIYTKK